MLAPAAPMDIMVPFGNCRPVSGGGPGMDLPVESSMYVVARWMLDGDVSCGLGGLMIGGPPQTFGKGMVVGNCGGKVAGGC